MFFRNADRGSASVDSIVTDGWNDDEDDEVDDDDDEVVVVVAAEEEVGQESEDADEPRTLG